MINTKFWVGVACKEHVENGIKLGICQFCHGKSGPVQRLRKGDYIVYYSSKCTMNSNALYQKFTAVGRVIDDEPYQVEMFPGFYPYRRNVEYFVADHLDIRPLILDLDFIKNKASWGATFRYGFLEIDKASFDIIFARMVKLGSSLRI